MEKFSWSDFVNPGNILFYLFLPLTLPIAIIRWIFFRS